jgi:hypothetical protein
MNDPNTILGSSAKTTNSQYVYFPRNPFRQIVEVILGIVFLVGAWFVFSLLLTPAQHTPDTVKAALFFLSSGMVIISLTFWNVAYARACGPISWSALWAMKGMPFLLLAVGVQFLWKLVFYHRRQVN